MASCLRFVVAARVVVAAGSRASEPDASCGKLPAGVGLEVIGAGPPRTGTQSVAAALRLLGFDTVHNTGDEAERRAWWAHANGTTAFEEPYCHFVARGAQAVLDDPYVSSYAELLRRSPEAKVILTLHPGGPKAYAASVRKYWNTPPLSSYTNSGQARYFGPFSGCEVKSMEQSGWDEACATGYSAWVDDVRATVPEKSLLVFSVDQGWGPLCAFLSREVPTDEEGGPRPFPREDFVKLFPLFFRPPGQGLSVDACRDTDRPLAWLDSSHGSEREWTCADWAAQYNRTDGTCDPAQIAASPLCNAACQGNLMIIQTLCPVTCGSCQTIVCKDLPFPLAGLGLPSASPSLAWSCADYAAHFGLQPGDVCHRDVIAAHPKCGPLCQKKPDLIIHRCPVTCGACPSS